MDTRLKYVFRLLSIFIGAFSVSVGVEVILTFITGIKDTTFTVLTYSLFFGVAWVIVDIVKRKRRK